MAAATPAAGGPPAVAPGLPASPVVPTTFAEWHGANANPCADTAQLLQLFRDEPHLVRV